MKNTMLNENYWYVQYIKQMYVWKINIALQYQVNKKHWSLMVINYVIN